MTVEQDSQPTQKRRKAAAPEMAAPAPATKSKTRVKPGVQAKVAGAQTKGAGAQARSVDIKQEPAPTVAAPPPAPEASASALMVAPDFAAAAENMALLVDEGRKALSAAVSADASDAQSEFAANVADATRSLGAVVESWMSRPEQAAKAQADLLSGLTEIWSQALHRYQGEDMSPVVPPDPSDKRFAAPEWTQNPFFDWLRQSYTFASRWAGDMVEQSEGVDSHTKARAAFYTRLLTSSVSPSNFVATNPELLKATLDARGANLVRGMKMLAEDIAAGGGTLKIRQTDDSRFRLGVDMANTPGKVVLRNDVMELIQYAPTTETVYRTPLLIVPPWINKFYVLDLTAEKSFVRWAVEQGITVFVISWVNPDESRATKGFDSYMFEGPLAALDAIEKATGEREVAAAGYCVGGTMLASTLAWMAAKGDKRIVNTTFFATQVDFTDPGDLQIFVDEAKLAALDEAMARTGYLEGVKMANAFNMMRPNELIWNYVTNNYMKGVEPAAFDLLAWNADCTRIPRANHLFYLRSCYLENRLAKKEMEMDGIILDLSKISIPIYELAARDDHIAPAKSVFRGSKLFGGEVTYVLAGAGHIAGVINPPAKNKYQYWTNPAKADSYEQWTATATETKGSWWPDWLKWFADKAGPQVPARQPGDGKLTPVCDAPGEYVLVRA